MYLFVSVYVHLSAGPTGPEAWRSPKARIIDNCERTDVGVGNQAFVPCKCSKTSLQHLTNALKKKQPTLIFILIYFLVMCICLCKYMSNVCRWPWRTEEGAGALGGWVTGVVSQNVGSGNQTFIFWMSKCS